MLVPRTSNPRLPRGYISGMTLTYLGATSLSFAAGAVRDADDTANIKIDSAMTKFINATWAAGSGNGGRGGALSPNATYFCFAILKSTTGDVDFGFDSSLTATNLLSVSGYDKYRRVGAILTDGSSNIQSFLQNGDLFTPTATQVGYSVTNVAPVSNAGINISFIPTGIQVRLLGQMFCGAINNQSTGYAWISAAGQTSPGAESTSVGGNGESTIMMAHGAHTAGEASANWHQGQTTFQLMTNTSGQLTLTTATSIGGNVSVRIRVMGWIDDRGKN